MKECGGEKDLRRKWAGWLEKNSYLTSFLHVHTHNTPHHRASQCADSCGGGCPQFWPAGGGSGILHTLCQRQDPAEERAGQEYVCL